MQARHDYNSAIAAFERVTATATAYDELFEDPLVKKARGALRSSMPNCTTGGRKLTTVPRFLNLLFTLSSEAVNLAFTRSPDASSGLPLVCSGGERRCVQCHRFIAVTRVIGRPRRAPGPASLLRCVICAHLTRAAMGVRCRGSRPVSGHRWPISAGHGLHKHSCIRCVPHASVVPPKVSARHAG